MLRFSRKRSHTSSLNTRDRMEDLWETPSNTYNLIRKQILLLFLLIHYKLFVSDAILLVCLSLKLHLILPLILLECFKVQINVSFEFLGELSETFEHLIVLGP
jgi:hypothetical protein